MKRRSRLQHTPALLAVFLGAVALGAFGARRVADDLWPARREQGRHISAARGEIAGRTTGDVGERAARDAGPAAGPLPAGAVAPAPGAAGGAAAPAPDRSGEPATEAERAAADRLAADLKRLVRDLEFNAQFPEPPQQVVREPPAPWRPEPGADHLAPPTILDLVPRHAPSAGGARVTIRGRNLRVFQVMFGALAARVVSATEEAVTVVAPGGSAGPVVVALTNDDGTYAVSAVPFSYD